MVFLRLLTHNTQKYAGLESVLDEKGLKGPSNQKVAWLQPVAIYMLTADWRHCSSLADINIKQDPVAEIGNKFLIKSNCL